MSSFLSFSALERAQLAILPVVHHKDDNSCQTQE